MKLWLVFKICGVILQITSIIPVGAAWGFHFANNVVAILVVSLSGTLSGLALYVTPFGPAETETLVPLLLRDMATTVAIWAAIRFALAKTGR